MKTKHILLAVALLLSFNMPTQAQNSDLADNFSGIGASLSETFSGVSKKASELGRWYWLRQGDIQMWMNAKFEGYSKGVAIPGTFTGVAIYETESKGSIYGEFDWDNKALKMHLTESENKSGLKIGSKDIAKSHSSDQLQYTDKEGFWYVPFDNPDKNGPSYIKFNAKKAAIGGLNELQGLLSDDIVLQLIGLAKMIDLGNIELSNIGPYLAGFLSSESNYALMLKSGKDLTSEMKEQIKETLKELLNEQNAYMVGFPIFIHWALMYSPDAIKEKFEVNETTVSYRGMNCTKLTVTSGDEKGKYMVFDQYNRLVFIDALKDGTVRFAYGKDLTVKLPAAVNMPPDMMGNFKLPSKN